MTPAKYERDETVLQYRKANRHRKANIPRRAIRVYPPCFRAHYVPVTLH